jgi:hypothetical protein
LKNSTVEFVRKNNAILTNTRRGKLQEQKKSPPIQIRVGALHVWHHHLQSMISISVKGLE